MKNHGSMRSSKFLRNNYGYILLVALTLALSSVLMVLNGSNDYILYTIWAWQILSSILFVVYIVMQILLKHTECRTLKYTKVLERSFTLHFLNIFAGICGMSLAAYIYFHRTGYMDVSISDAVFDGWFWIMIYTWFCMFFMAFFFLEKLKTKKAV
jgi:hypothetical protein